MIRFDDPRMEQKSEIEIEIELSLDSRSTHPTHIGQCDFEFERLLQLVVSTLVIGAEIAGHVCPDGVQSAHRIIVNAPDQSVAM